MDRRRKSPRSTLLKYLFVAAVLMAALVYGRSRGGPDVIPSVRAIFPRAAQVEESGNVYAARAVDGAILGWAGVGTASGYGGPMLVVVGVDPEGHIVGTEVVEHRETPLFMRMAKVPRFFSALTGASFDEVDYDYERVAGVTGASRSASAVTESVRAAVMKVAVEKFEATYAPVERQFEFGILEITILALFTVGIASQYLHRTMRERLRWASQIAGLLVIGFWENSPVTLAKIGAFLSGYLPSLHANLSVYLLLAGFALTVLIFGSSIYCSHVCPFGAAQRCVGVIGGGHARLPAWSTKLLRRLRGVIVFLALVAALFIAKPALVSYEPFAVLFALKGTLLQWFLLLVVLVASLVIQRPWCHFFCPMRVCERVLQDVRRRAIQSWRNRGHA